MVRSGKVHNSCLHTGEAEGLLAAHPQKKCKLQNKRHKGCSTSPRSKTWTITVVSPGGIACTGKTKKLETDVWKGGGQTWNSSETSMLPFSFSFYSIQATHLLVGYTCNRAGSFPISLLPYISTIH